MTKSNTVLKRTVNALLDLVATHEAYSPLPSESELARRLDVSRTTTRGALAHLIDQRVLTQSEARILVVRSPAPPDYYTDFQTSPPAEHIERLFMGRVLDGGWRPGRRFTEADLARDAGVSTASVREFLIGFSRFHLIEKRPRGGWRLLGFDASFANEVADMRELIEFAALDRMPNEPAPPWLDAAAKLLERHRALRREVATRFMEFPALDRDFHLWIIAHLGNRFAHGYFDIVSFLFHYHYQWRHADECARNTVALDEHIAVLDALLAGDRAGGRERLGAHLTTSRRSLFRSLDDH